MTAAPVAFLSYVRTDDAHLEGRISALRARLEGEIRMQTGDRRFRVLQDTVDVRPGDVWQRWIDGSLDAAAVLVPVLTPGYFTSAACRDEWARFRAREEALGRDDLVVPIYYVDCDAVNDEAARAGDPMAVDLARRQYVDWRDLRHEPLASAAAGRRLEAIALKVKAVLASGLDRPARRAPTDAGASMIGRSARRGDGAPR